MANSVPVAVGYKPGVEGRIEEQEFRLRSGKDAIAYD
jgi:hypothetical protein